MAFSVCLFSGCNEEELSGSNFDTSSPQRNEFDKWLLENYVKEYNIEFKYHFDDSEGDFSYNLIPAEMGKSEQMAFIVKKLWLESYDELFDPTGRNKDFMRSHAPKIIQLIGSSAINSSSGTEVLGTAEGGIKVLLYKVNSVDPTNIDLLNEYYFGTMHHEFAHILHQKKNYPVEFNEITSGDYSSTGWQNRTLEQSWKLGFVSSYGGMSCQEDFVEIIANYLIKPKEYWNNMLEKAGENGRSKIEEKFDIVKEWLFTAWEIDIDQLKEIIDRRSEELEIILKDGDYDY